MQRISSTFSLSPRYYHFLFSFHGFWSRLLICFSCFSRFPPMISLLFFVLLLYAKCRLDLHRTRCLHAEHYSKGDKGDIYKAFSFHSSNNLVVDCSVQLQLFLGFSLSFWETCASCDLGRVAQTQTSFSAAVSPTVWLGEDCIVNSKIKWQK